MQNRSLSRRRFLKTTALAATSVVAAPYMRTSHAAGRLSLGLWDHFVPGATDALKQMCVEWGAKNHVEIQADVITSVGGKLLLTAAAEAQAKTGHDVMTLARWMTTIHRERLAPVDEVMRALTQEYGPPNQITEYLAKHDGMWRAVPATFGGQLHACCSRLDLYREHAGIDLAKIFPPRDDRDKALVEGWNWDTYLASAEKLQRAGFPVGLPMGQTADSIAWTGALFQSFGAVMIDDKDRIKVNSDETRAVLDYAKKLMPLNPPDVYAWDDTGNNKWLISGKGAGIMNPPSAWAVAKRDNPKVAEQCWTHDMPRGPKGRFQPYLPYFWGIWKFSQNKAAAKSLMHHISERSAVEKMVAASQGYDIPAFAKLNDFKTWADEGPPKGTLYHYPPKPGQILSIAGFPAPPKIAAQIYTQAIMTKLVAKCTQ